MECDLPSVKHKNFLIRIVGNFSNLFQHLGNKHFYCLQSFLTNKQIFVVKIDVFNDENQHAQSYFHFLTQNIINYDCLI